jgi:ATP-binding cassette subfamily F protein 3
MNGCGAGKTEQEYRALLGAFLFGGDDIDKKIKVLSGGEKARVALAKVIASKANFLMLDEPTNHLDIHSVELLVEALNKYEGTIILVSHDRYFISKAANKIWEIIDGEIKEFKGTYAEWVEWKERMAANNKIETPAPKKEEKPKEIAPPAEQKPAAPVSINKEVKKELQKQQRLFQQLEEKIAELKAQQSKLEADLGLQEIYGDKNKFTQTEAAYKATLDELDKLNKEYEVVFEKIVDM